MFTISETRRQAIKGITIVQLRSETAFKGLLCIDLTGMTDDTDVIRACVVQVTACVVHVTAALVDSVVDSLVDDAVDHVLFSVGACVVAVEFVKCRAVELAVVDGVNDCVVGAVVVVSVAVVVSFRLQRGS